MCITSLFKYIHICSVESGDARLGGRRALPAAEYNYNPPVSSNY